MSLHNQLHTSSYTPSPQDELYIFQFNHRIEFSRYACPCSL